MPYARSVEFDPVNQIRAAPRRQRFIFGVAGYARLKVETPSAPDSIIIFSDFN